MRPEVKPRMLAIACKIKIIIHKHRPTEGWLVSERRCEITAYLSGKSKVTLLVIEQNFYIAWKETMPFGVPIVIGWS